MGSFARMSLFVLCACGGDLPRPAYVGQHSDALTPVQYPPPPARVEFVPKRPTHRAVWIDGEWVWQGRRWSWRTGRWVVPPAGAGFSPWTMVRGEDGTTYYAGGTWRDAHGRILTAPTALALAKANSGEIDEPGGEVEQTTRMTHESQTPESLDGGVPGSDGGSD